MTTGRWCYPTRIAKEPTGEFIVTFPDVPEAITFAKSRDAALRRAVSALETALAIYIDDRRDLPTPSPARGRPVVMPGLQARMKLELYRAMRRKGARKADLARRLNVHAPQIDRLLDLTHASRIGQIEAAMAALDQEVLVMARDAA
jgi:antitoxin HicB